MKRPAILFVICLYLLTSILTSTSVQALSIATSEAEITNVTFNRFDKYRIWFCVRT